MKRLILDFETSADLLAALNLLDEAEQENEFADAFNVERVEKEGLRPFNELMDEEDARRLAASVD